MRACFTSYDEKFREAGDFWTRNQSFMLQLIENWDFQKLIIQNESYRWNEQTDRVLEFIRKLVLNF
jgi:hypothetical protein